MKPHQSLIFAWSFVLVLGLTLVLRSQTESPLSIQWTWNNGKLFERYSQSRTLQFGLRSDGIVVWREVIASTNSPAEYIPIRHRSDITPQVVPSSPPPLPR